MIARARLASLAGRWVWKTPRRAARLLESFRRAEASSMLDLLAAARATSSPARSALYLAHALDEDRHARAFRTRSRALDEDVQEGVVDFDALYDRLGEVGFLAFVHRGEQRGRAQFEQHRDRLRAAGDDRGATLFEGILVDEERHERYTRTLLVELTGSEAATTKALRRAAMRSALWTWRRAGRTIAATLFTIAASILFVAIAPLALGYRALRPAARGWQR